MSSAPTATWASGERWDQALAGAMLAHPQGHRLFPKALCILDSPTVPSRRATGHTAAASWTPDPRAAGGHTAPYPDASSGRPGPPCVPHLLSVSPATVLHPRKPTGPQHLTPQSLLGQHPACRCPTWLCTPKITSGTLGSSPTSRRLPTHPWVSQAPTQTGLVLAWPWSLHTGTPTGRAPGVGAECLRGNKGGF